MRIIRNIQRDRKVLNLKHKLNLAKRNIKAYRRYFDFSSEAIIVHHNCIVSDVNQTAIDLFGYSRKELIDRNILYLIPLKKYVPDILRHMQEDFASYTIEGVHKNGLVIPISIQGKTISGTRGKLRVTCVRDISKEIDAENTLNMRDMELSHSKDTLIQQEHKFEALFNISFNAYIIHIKGKVQEVNEMFTKLFGYTKEEAANLDLANLFPDQKEVERYRAEMKKNKRCYFVGKQRRRDGTVFDAEIVANSEMLNGKEVRLVTIKDISKLVESELSLKEKNKELINRNNELEIMREEVHSSRNALKQYIHDNQLNISDKDLQNIIIYGRWHYDFPNKNFIWTDETKNILGNANDSTICNFDEFVKHVHPEDREDLENAFFNAVKESNYFKAEFRFKTDKGKEKYILAQGLADYKEDDSINAILGTMVDITERKNIENRLKRQKDHYLRLNEDLIISRKKAEDSEKLKTAFFSNMSHEIRTPMNGILGFSNLLMDPELSKKDRLEYAQVIVDSGKRLLHIVNDVLDISKLESDTVKIVKTEVNVNNLLDTLQSLYNQEEKVKAGKLKLVLRKALPDDKSIIKTDHNRLNQLFTNLLSNALKFTEKGRVTFGYHVASDALNFFVEDTGIGIPDDMKDCVFEPFRQVEGHLVREYGGTGLGLSISKRLTRLLGGDMTLESEENKGSRFNFTLPYNKPKGPMPIKKVQVPQKNLKDSVHDICLLIAEDDDVNFLFYKSLFGKRLKLLRAKTGTEAVEKAKNNDNIDVVLMDVKMPEMSGYDAIKEIRKFSPDLPIIVQTAYAMPTDKQDAFDAGADDYISKPINRHHLLEKIKKLCMKE